MLPGVATTSAAGQSVNDPSSVMVFAIVVGAGVAAGSAMMYSGVAAGEDGRQAGRVVDQGGEIDRGRRGPAGGRQQRLGDREFDALAVAGKVANSAARRR